MAITPNKPADFTPELGRYNNVENFRFWVQSVLPCVYDDSLSYYELLNKVIHALNAVIQDVNTSITDIESLHDAYEQLQSYVNDYFTSLDVQQEIDKKLDDMASDGSLSRLLEPFIPDIITNWLRDNITPTSPAIDKSFLVGDAGADSKTVGDKTHWFRGNIRDGLLSDLRDNGWYYISPSATCEDVPEELSNIAFIHIYRSEGLGYPHAIQEFYMYPNKFYTRDILLSGTPQIGKWISRTSNNFNTANVPADSKQVGDKTHWFRGNITDGLLSDMRRNGWYYISPSATSTDVPEPLTNIAFLHVYQSEGLGYPHALQEFYMYPNIYYTRDIILSDPVQIGGWQSRTDSTLTKVNIPADSYIVGEKTHWFRGNITSGLLSDRNQNGWYYVSPSTTSTDVPEPLTNIAFLHVYQSRGYGDPHAIQEMYIYPDKHYIRDIRLTSTPQIGNWINQKRNLLPYKGDLPANADVNEYNTLGIWNYTGTAVSNLPDERSGILLNLGGTAGYQLFFDNVGKLYTRRAPKDWTAYANPNVSTANKLQAFYRAMNAKAKALGMNNTVFTSATGLNTTNLSTANDMLKLCVYANSCGFAKYGMREYSIDINGTYTLLTNNPMYDSILGTNYDVVWGKTGGVTYSDVQHQTLMCVAIHKETKIKLAGVIMGATSATNRFTAMHEVFDATIRMINGGSQGTNPYATMCASCVISDDGNFTKTYVQQNADEQELPASMTKVMSILVSSEIDTRYALKYNVNQYAVESGGNLKANDRISYGDLCYDMMLNSVNTAAKELAIIWGEYYYLIENNIKPIF